MLWPDPLCRKCERHLAGNGALWSARLVFLTTRFCVGPQNLPASAEALAMSEACGWTSDCRKTKLNYLYVWSNVCDFDIQIEKENKKQKKNSISFLRALHLPVPGAVHWLQSKYVIFHGEGEHIFAVVLPVARCLPQFAVINVGGGYFLKASSPVLILEKQQTTLAKHTI